MAGPRPDRTPTADGRWVHRRPDGTVVDLRIETVPTLYGEDLAMRLLDRQSRLLGLDALGLSRDESRRLHNILDRPGGLVLVAGPSGSGKTTTLYAMLAELNDGSRKINTIEDPIDYALPHVRQSQVNLRIGLDFPDLLRAVLRQGADVILVGEIRDPVTAQTAVRQPTVATSSWRRCTPRPPRQPCKVCLASVSIPITWLEHCERRLLSGWSARFARFARYWWTRCRWPTCSTESKLVCPPAGPWRDVGQSVVHLVVEWGSPAGPVCSRYW